MARKEFEVIISRLDQPRSYQYRLRSWQFYFLIVLVVMLILLGIIGIFLIGYTNQQHLLISYLTQRNVELEEENKKVSELANKLRFLENEYAKIAIMLGADKNPPPLDINKLAEAYAPLVSPEIKDTTKKWQVLPTTNFVITARLSSIHDGIDFAAQLGTPVYAIAPGYIEDVGNDTFYGNYVKLIVHNKYLAFYGHLYKTIKNKGARVQAGEIIGYVGSSGKAKASHLHFELWEITDKGKVRLDPEQEFSSLLKEYKRKNP
ncbi:MAG: M23 family metallopeptidase [candidate division WOR-3 bacterium]|nr:M23 family metallopeptidase [candidate division WOR-3 bacterium]MCX7757676.1 M23 family metallopeptidase [candidate division WOR-3 bacterium]MDW7987961.1 M23 family metallopeptidase [candidate division WOR-3 bacterium]